MSKHTPGPWTIERSGENLVVIHRGQHVTTYIAEWDLSHDPSVGINCPDNCAQEIEANALAIHAAPNLLAACIAARDQIEHDQETIDGEFGTCRSVEKMIAVGAMPEAWTLLQDAIAKATGAKP